MIVPRSVAFDEGDAPAPAPWAEWYVVGTLCTRAQAAAIRAAGSKLIVKVQPVRWLNPDGTPRLANAYDAALRGFALLVCDDATYASLDAPGEGMGGSYVLDFASAWTIAGMAQLVAGLADQLGAVGVMQDYGCSSLDGAVSHKVSDWSGWTFGYQRYREKLMSKGLRLWNCCNRQSVPGASLLIENIQPGGTETGYPPNPLQAYDRCIENPGTILLVQNADAVNRKMIVAAALLGGGYVDYRPNFFTGDRVSREPAPELVIPPAKTLQRLAAVLT